MSKRSSNHVGTLLRKDWLILNRNWLYLVMFVFIPFIMMGSFWYLKSTLEFELTPEKHNFYGKSLTHTLIDTCYFSDQVQQAQLLTQLFLGIGYGLIASPGLRGQY